MPVSIINLSIIIPTLNEENIIESTLNNLCNNRGNFEIIIADGGSSDNTMEIVSNFTDVKRVTTSPGRAHQMNIGARVAQGEILLFLHADTCLPQEALKHIDGVMSDPSTAAGSFYLDFDLNNILLKIYSLFSRINHIFFTYGDQALFVRSHLFKTIGGFPDMPIMEDVEIQRRLRERGKFVKIGNPVVSSARRYVKQGIIRQQIMNTALVALYYLGVSPSFLERFYSSVK
jgi:rSAM/selenodomain-associated transferase 2